MALPKHTTTRIYEESLEYASDLPVQLAYRAGAMTEAERGYKLVRELESMRDGYDHDEDAHKYNNLPACRVCAATKALAEYNSPNPVKP